MHDLKATADLIAGALLTVSMASTISGCSASKTETLEPSGGGPTASAPAATFVARSPAPTTWPGTTPTATRLPSPVAGVWVSGGSTIGTYDPYGLYPSARLVALPEGGAVLFGIPTDDQGSPIGEMLATERWDPQTGWRQGASIATPGGGFAAVPLRDGRVLIAGGQTATAHSTATALIYDPASDAWSTSGNMGTPRTNAAAAILSDGRVLVVGGFTWDQSAATNSDGTGRVSLVDVILDPFGPALATAELFDPASGSWSPTGPMRFARTGPSIAVLRDGRVLVVGASWEPTRIDARAFTTAEVYVPAAGTFRSAAALLDVDRATLARRGVDLPEGAPEPDATGALVALPDGGAALIGHAVSWKHEGQAVWSMRLAPDLRSWRPIGEPFGQRDFWDEDGGGRQVSGLSRLGAMVAPLADGGIFVGGGSAGYSVYGRDPVSVERFNPVNDAWASGPRLPEARELPLMACLADGTLLLVGGLRDVGEGDDATTEWARDAWRLLPGGWSD